MFAKLLTALRQQSLGALALFIVLGGTSYAVATGSIDSREIKNGQVKRVDLDVNSVDSRKVREGSLLAGDFKRGQLPAGPQGPRGATGLQGPKGDPGAPATRLWAQVTTTGELAANSGAVSAQRTAAGDYRLVFNRPVEACARVVTAGETSGFDAALGPRIARTDAREATVDVYLLRHDGASTDSSFNIAVFC